MSDWHGSCRYSGLLYKPNWLLEVKVTFAKTVSLEAGLLFLGPISRVNTAKHLLTGGAWLNPPEIVLETPAVYQGSFRQCLISGWKRHQEGVERESCILPLTPSELKREQGSPTPLPLPGRHVCLCTSAHSWGQRA